MRTFVRVGVQLALADPGLSGLDNSLLTCPELNASSRLPSGPQLVRACDLCQNGK
jgi:hypothetical protein